MGPHLKLGQLRLGYGIGSSVFGPHTKLPKACLLVWRVQMGMRKLGKLANTMDYDPLKIQIDSLSILSQYPVLTTFKNVKH